MDVMFKWKERKRMFTNSFTFILVQPRTTRFAPSCIILFCFPRSQHVCTNRHGGAPAAAVACSAEREGCRVCSRQPVHSGGVGQPTAAFASMAACSMGC